MPAETDTRETKALENYLKDPNHGYLLSFIRAVEMTPYELERYFHPFEEMKGEEELYESFERENYRWDEVDWEAVFQSCVEE